MDGADGHPPLHPDYPSGCGRVDVNRIELWDRLLCPDGYLINEPPGVKAMHVEAGFEAPPFRRRRSGTSAHVSVDGHRSADPLSAGQKLRSDAEGSSKGVDGFLRRLSQVVLVARQRRLGDPDSLRKLCLGDPLGPASDLERFTERGHP
jgi:hypothetical protein